MVNVKWVYTIDDKYFQIVLRHGRKSGIRKIYVNKDMVERTKSLAGYFIDRGSTHTFKVGDRDATINIQRGKSASFTYVRTPPSTVPCASQPLPWRDTGRASRLRPRPGMSAHGYEEDADVHRSRDDGHTR